MILNNPTDTQTQIIELSQKHGFETDVMKSIILFCRHEKKFGDRLTPDGAINSVQRGYYLPEAFDQYGFSLDNIDLVKIFYGTPSKKTRQKDQAEAFAFGLALRSLKREPKSYITDMYHYPSKFSLRNLEEAFSQLYNEKSYNFQTRFENERPALDTDPTLYWSMIDKASERMAADMEISFGDAVVLNVLNNYPDSAEITAHNYSNLISEIVGIDFDGRITPGKTRLNIVGCSEPDASSFLYRCHMWSENNSSDISNMSEEHKIAFIRNQGSLPYGAIFALVFEHVEVPDYGKLMHSEEIRKSGLIELVEQNNFPSVALRRFVPGTIDFSEEPSHYSPENHITLDYKLIHDNA